MSTRDTQSGIVQDLGEAIDDLHDALQRATTATAAFNELQNALERASGATAAIKGLLPRVGAISSVFDELEAVIESGRQQFGAETAPQQPTAFSRPTLVPSTPEVQEFPVVEPAEQFTPAETVTPPAPIETTRFEPEAAPFEDSKSAESPAPAAEGELTAFRLEFESRPGPLDLRAVDEAVSDHPAVRDVALLDYDGRKATLKVWIVGTARPSDVQEALSDRAPKLFPGGNDVTIVALEDVA